jgi:hypothetical protein
MISIPSAIRLFSVMTCAALAACAGASTASVPQRNPTPQPAAVPQEKPEPVPTGIKPLTLEQEEMISQ